MRCFVTVVIKVIIGEPSGSFSLTGPTQTMLSSRHSHTRVLALDRALSLGLPSSPEICILSYEMFLSTHP